MNSNFDVIVIGGGPSGMMAAGCAAQQGAKVLLLDRNNSLGRKLLITGKGRSNLTRAEFDVKELIAKYGREGGFLFAPFSVFGVKQTVEFFNERGLETKVERGKRIFPQSDSAKDVLHILLDYLAQGNVEVKTNAQVQEIVAKGKKIIKIVLKDGREFTAKNYVLATGGKSFPGTGSTGDGYSWLEKLGHKVEKLRPALVPFRIREGWVKEAQGLSLKNVELSVFQNGRKQETRFGEMLFTHFGISGPIVLDLSFKVGELLERGEVRLVLDLKPALDLVTLDKRLQSDFVKYGKKLFENALDDLLPQKLIPIVVDLSGINPAKKVSEIAKEERYKLAKLLKSMEMRVLGLLDFDMAIVTAGGVSLQEIDAKTMRSKVIDNLFLCGEIINLHGPTGGYNLQQSWSTGYLAGLSASQNK